MLNTTSGKILYRKYANYSLLLNIVHTTFSLNSTTKNGGVIFTLKTSFCISNSTFSTNTGSNGGVIYAYDSSFNITDSRFINNSADVSTFGFTTDKCTNNIGPHASKKLPVNITSTNNENSATYEQPTQFRFRYSFKGCRGGVILSHNSSSNIINSTFYMNTAIFVGVVFLSNWSSSFITSCTFANNSAFSTTILQVYDSNNVTIADGISKNNIAKLNRAVSVVSSSIYIINCVFKYNVGSLHALSLNVTFTGYVEFKNCTGSTENMQEGGAITSYQSNLLFTGVNRLIRNHANWGGALFVIGSTVTVYGQTTMANNSAISSTAGGIYLDQSYLKIFGNCHISHNSTVMGGGIHACSSTVSVYQPGLLRFLKILQI